MLEYVIVGRRYEPNPLFHDRFFLKGVVFSLYRILERQDLTPNIHLFKIDAPKVAAKARKIAEHRRRGDRWPGDP